MKNKKTETKKENKKRKKEKEKREKNEKLISLKVQPGNSTHTSTAPKISFHLLWLI